MVKTREKEPEKTTEEEKQKRKRKKKTKQTITHAVTHIRLIEANPGKLDALDQLVVVYLALCQQYVTLFCEAETSPDKYADPVFESELSERWQRVAYSKQQASPSPGAPIGRTPMKPTWKIWLITLRPRPKRKLAVPP